MKLVDILVTKTIQLKDNPMTYLFYDKRFQRVTRRNYRPHDHDSYIDASE